MRRTERYADSYEEGRREGGWSFGKTLACGGLLVGGGLLLKSAIKSLSNRNREQDDPDVVYDYNDRDWMDQD